MPVALRYGVFMLENHVTYQDVITRDHEREDGVPRVFP